VGWTAHDATLISLRAGMYQAVVHRENSSPRARMHRNGILWTLRRIKFLPAREDAPSSGCCSQEVRFPPRARGCIATLVLVCDLYRRLDASVDRLVAEVAGSSPHARMHLPLHVLTAMVGGFLSASKDAPLRVRCSRAAWLVPPRAWMHPHIACCIDHAGGSRARGCIQVVICERRSKGGSTVRAGMHPGAATPCWYPDSSPCAGMYRVTAFR
jgi:hypothetical protein